MHNFQLIFLFWPSTIFLVHYVAGGDKKALSQSVESMHQFSDEGGGEADPLDISNLYNKLGEDAGEEGGGENNINQMGFGEAPAQIGSLSSVTDASEEFTGACFSLFVISAVHFHSLCNGLQ